MMRHLLLANHRKPDKLNRFSATDSKRTLTEGIFLS